MTSVTWSYSALTAYEQCPWRYYLTRVVKEVREPETPATKHGVEVHSALEKYVAGDADLPEKYADLRRLADRIRNAKGEKLLEYRFALNRQLKPTEFFATDVWVRGVFDVAIVTSTKVAILDYKTGKRKVDNDQLQLFAAAAFKLWPSVDVVKTGYIWLKDKKIDAEDFERRHAGEIWAGYVARVQRIEASMESGKWPKRPSGLCRRWCPVGRARCEHCGE